jgi:hypothetical protein
MNQLANINARNRYNSLSPVAKEARKEQMREYARQHRRPKIGFATRDGNKARVVWVQVLIVETKIAIGSCADCGLPCEDWNHVMFAFDHLVPREKLFSMSKAYKVRGVTKEMLIAEMEKCELVCHNCHAFRTYIERHHDYRPRLEPVSSPLPLFESC